MEYCQKTPRRKNGQNEKPPIIRSSPDNYTSADSRNPFSNASSPETRNTYSTKSMKAAAATTSGIITRFGISEIVISDNGTQFTDKKFREFLEGLHVSHRFSSVEHPQTNGQVEAANKIIVKGLKKWLDEAKGLRANELGSVLWSYRTTPQTTTGKTPFRLTYSVEAVIPVEIGNPSPRRTVGGNDEDAERDLIDEERSIAHVRELALKQRISLRYNHGVIRREFEPNDLVLRRNDIGTPTPGEGKLTPNWEGLYRIKATIGKGAYKLERLNGDEIPRTWNATNLRLYYT
ncbi:uncharacterized protein K02A2.6-like [Arachis ipaensis]|uniref:uncharacterized protein K02A2.6-like n=1 Tax=Arachis ipaensis TaxID=130454 RepID=UPI0007AF50A3|nr:uncharacterized protein K02A2.6-like [Arachis ipaensis]XP_025636370.1 uncharacterized protein K02A2.6-like [Arachis hypogaea]